MNPISKIKLKHNLSPVKEGTSHSAKHVERAKQPDTLCLSNEAKEALHLSKFVDMLRKMPDIRNQVLEKEFNFDITPREIAKKMLNEMKGI